MKASAVKLYRTTCGPILEADGKFHRLPENDWDTLVNRDDLFEHLRALLADAPEVKNLSAPPTASLLAPLGTQEIWAAGVNYTTGKFATMKEAEASGPGVFYQRIYHAARPHLFFKAPHYRVAGPGGSVQVRRDSTWSFPEPELTLFITSNGKIVALTVGNDISSGSIEGENPLYLSQAKTHDACAALGPCLRVGPEPLAPDALISLSLQRDGREIFSGSISIGKINRPFENLVDYLFRETSFPTGVFLMTGAGVIPPPECTLMAGDEITMSIEGIGTLQNYVVERQ